jgi:hypothetical protein
MLDKSPTILPSNATDPSIRVQNSCNLQRGAVGFDAIKHLVLCRIERRPPRLDMAIYPYLPRATVATTSARDYLGLLAGAMS